MREDRLEELLAQVAAGAVDPDEAGREILASTYLDIGVAKLDLHRAERNGVDEAVFAEGKSPDDTVDISDRIVEAKGRLLVTRLEEGVADRILERHPAATYHSRARVLTFGEAAAPDHRVAVLAAGTSDLAVADEAAVCAAWLGAEVERHNDVGVAGLHRLFSRLDGVKRADVVIVAAGMDGALPSVVAGLVAVPVIALPTSVGYGASFRGLAALLTMLNSCAPGVAVVNIDNGFGAAVLARRICGDSLQAGDRSSSIASP